MKAKTKRRLRHLVTKKPIIKRKTSKHLLRTFLIGLTTISMGSLAYAITLNKPTVSVNVRSSGPGGLQIAAPATPAPASTSNTVGPTQSGRASWYALGLAAPDALTCASRTFPRGSYLHVTDLSNGHSMTCLVNDYGPALWTGRVLDLSRGSFEQIASLGAGTIPVGIQAVSAPSSFHVTLNATVQNAAVGYRLCRTDHPLDYCDAHRQD